MKHFASSQFWKFFHALPSEVQELARQNFELLKSDPHHPSLRFKKAGHYWSARVGLHYRALAKEVEGGFLRGWIGPHDEYLRIIG